ncbi:MAG: 50S ribosomal protein L32 [Myxococcota bacterium]
MAVPKKRTSKRRKNMRRAHDALKFSASVMICPACGETKLRHRVCMSCGTYRGRQVINIEETAPGPEFT